MLNKKALSATAGAADKLYVESVFSSYLYTGNSSTQTITNNIDLSGEGGMVWIKNRSNSSNHIIDDTVNGANWQIYPNLTNNAGGNTNRLTAFNNNGFNLGYIATDNSVNESGSTYASWTFRKAEKFFDVVTYTGDGTSNRSIAHNLGSVPGCIIIKQTNTTRNWYVYHRSLGAGTNGLYNLVLNSTGAQIDDGQFPSAATSTDFKINGLSGTNQSGGSYVAYLFAHDAGGFGASGTDNVISCGSFTGTNTTTSPINLGYEAQWILVKKTSGTSDWYLIDNMRGFLGGTTGDAAWLGANLANAESQSPLAYITPTGFIFPGDPSGSYIYIAIRRGPMKTPEAGTEVFNTIVRAGTGASASITTVGFPPDMMISHSTNVSSNNVGVNDKLRGAPQFLSSNTTNAESTLSGTLVSFDQSGFSVGATASGPFNISGQTNAHWNFRRAPGFFDVVCYTGTGSARTVSHNLGVAPELMIVKKRNGIEEWSVYSSSTGNTSWLVLNSDTTPSSDARVWNNTTPTSSVFTVGTGQETNENGKTYVSYLFASCSGVSKVGSYTGTGTTQQINCGFTGGARFVMIKRTDSTGGWYVWDTARGIVSGNDPYLLLNSTAVEVTNTDYIDTYSSGFEISSTAPAAINANGGTYIYLAIA